ncbi:hypothetical protein C7Y47_24125 [Lysinibacillus sphaericus]|uniref:Uncharacterized protein n=1 Tax=Lysinibacillus sphaericus TaxID=1421 RepID=A0A544U799_LYSSH|nr:hypothetical protein [Lysinibacillus sp. SDF0037]TQR26826.1 hypothetical protein C7Y47_24125 [Lysinibacillus sp. SDF0037]
MNRIIYYLLSLIKSYIKKIGEYFNSKDLEDIFSTYLLLFFIITGLEVYNGGGIFPIRLVTALIFFVLLIYIYIVRVKKMFVNVPNRYKYLMIFWGTFFCFSLFCTILITEVHIILKWFYLISFIFMWYFTLMFVISKWINKWYKYSLLFLFSPIIAFFSWVFLGGLLSLVTDNNYFVSDELLIPITLVFSIIIMNFVIYVSPYNKIDELKVAIYFLLAIFSTISYCFFLSDISTNLIFGYWNDDAEKEIIKQLTDLILKWFTLPYLIGMVCGCFTIELKQRNYKMKGNIQ